VGVLAVFAICSFVGGGHDAKATGEIGDRQAMADKATAPQIYGELGKGGSAAVFFADGLNSDN
jgi:hypothetical protein